jgi:chemotaxis signal transduction protein
LIDIGLILGFTPASITSQSRIFIVEDRGEYTGLLADQVSEVTEVADCDLQVPPANIPQEQLKFCRSVYKASSRVVLLLDTSALLESVPLATNQPQ